MNAVGGLSLVLPEGQSQQFRISSARVTIGRASTNNIVLRDARASREHALLDCSGRECVIVDLQSSNGTRVNGQAVQRAALKPGDTIEIGGSRLTIEAAAAAEPEDDATVVEFGGAMQAGPGGIPLYMNIEDTSTARLAICAPGGTREIRLDKDVVTIGRQPDNDVVLGSQKVSRRHARIERRNDGSFLIRDLQSDNGTYFAGQRISDRVLSEGDTFTIGDARLIYKAPFSSDDLTVVDAGPRAKDGGRRPVVLVPGFMGSKMYIDGQQVWPSFRNLLFDTGLFAYGNGKHAEARGVVDEVVIVPNLIKLEQYSLLLDYLEEALGYERGKDLLEFSYDFRQDVRTSARELGAAIESWDPRQPVTIIAHSLGCLVTRYYVEHLGGRKKTGRLILMAGANGGVPQSFAKVLQVGPKVLPFGLVNDSIRRVIASFPSLYQFLPAYPCVKDEQGRHWDILEDGRWLPEPQRALLNNAREFRAELSKQSTVPTVCIFGYGIKTIAGVEVERDETGACTKASIVVDTSGDSVIPECSTVMDNTEIHPVKQYHGTIFVDADVKKRLKLELAR